MTNQTPLPVSGYTKQSTSNVDKVNFNKALEEIVLRVVDENLDTAEIDKRWASVAKTHFEQGFMALNRSVFKPQRVELIDMDAVLARIEELASK